MNKKIALIVVIAVAAGAVGGYLYRRYTKPTFEERMQDAADDLGSAFKKATR
jgi:flagellar basal body-associated protein FliL